MQDLDDDLRTGPRLLTAVPATGEAPAVTDREAPVVPADRLLDTAGALAAGAARLHDELAHLEPSQRDAVLDLVAEQMHELISSWTELVRAVVSGGARPPDDTAGGRRGPATSATAIATATPAPGPERATGGRAPRTGRAELDHPARTSAPVSPPRAEPVFSVHHDPVDNGREADRLARDELTGVLGHEAGYGALAREIDRCRRGGERFVLGYLNVDGMTAINDARGLRAGDEVLRKVTAALRATLRSYDVIARLGGDEFLFSVPGADTTTADVRFKEFSVILAEEAPGTTASVGFAELHEDDTLDDLVASAETAMLKGRRARRRGRG